MHLPHDQGPTAPEPVEAEAGQPPEGDPAPEEGELMKATVVKSVTRRRKHVVQAKKKLQRWAHLTTLVKREDSGTTEEEFERDLQNARVNALLWAQAEIERALWLETGGDLGDEVSTPRRIVQRSGWGT